MAAEVNLTAWRHAPYGGQSGLADIIVFGVDWSAAAFAMSIGDTYGDSSVNKTLSNAAAGSEGVSATYDANLVNPATGVPGATIIRPYILETSMENTTTFPNASSASDDKVMYYDLQVTPSGGVKRVLMYGKFTIKPGVGQ